MQVWQWRESSREAMQHAVGAYMRNGYPWDEVRPLTCTGRRWDARERGTLDDSLGGFALTLVDSLDALALTGDLPAFRCGVSRVVNDVSFSRDVSVSVFETSIRVVGGLISAHILSTDEDLGIWRRSCPEGNCSATCGSDCAGVPCLSSYDGQLLSMADEVARRLLPAFDTPTGLPYHRVNLRTGQPDPSSRETCTAAAGTYLLEFGVLSRLTGDPVFEAVARRAVTALWQRRSALGLIGSGIDAIDGGWRTMHSGVGGGIDSWIEYLLKSGIALDDEELVRMYESVASSVRRHAVLADLHIEVSMSEGKKGPRPPHVSSLQAFYPGLEVLAGAVSEARSHYRPLASLWSRHGALPEDWDVTSDSTGLYGRDAPLRPELIESAYHLFTATRDPAYVLQAAEHLSALNNDSRVPCGYASVADVSGTGALPDRRYRLDDRMDSYFIAETTKYLFLTFDEALWHWYDGPTLGQSWRPCADGEGAGGFGLSQEGTVCVSQRAILRDNVSETLRRALPAPEDAAGVNEEEASADGARVRSLPPLQRYGGRRSTTTTTANQGAADAGRRRNSAADDRVDEDADKAESAVRATRKKPSALTALAARRAARKVERDATSGGSKGVVVVAASDSAPAWATQATESAHYYHQRLASMYPRAHPLAFMRYDNASAESDAIASLPLPQERVLYTTEGHVLLLGGWKPVLARLPGKHAANHEDGEQGQCPRRRAHVHAAEPPPLAPFAEMVAGAWSLAVSTGRRLGFSPADEEAKLRAEGITALPAPAGWPMTDSLTCNVTKLRGAMHFALDTRAKRSQGQRGEPSFDAPSTSSSSSKSLVVVDASSRAMVPIDTPSFLPSSWPDAGGPYPIAGSADLAPTALSSAYSSEIAPAVRGAYTSVLAARQIELHQQQQFSQQGQGQGQHAGADDPMSGLTGLADSVSSALRNMFAAFNGAQPPHGAAPQMPPAPTPAHVASTTEIKATARARGDGFEVGEWTGIALFRPSHFRAILEPATWLANFVTALHLQCNVQSGTAQCAVVSSMSNHLPPLALTIADLSGLGTGTGTRREGDAGRAGESVSISAQPDGSVITTGEGTQILWSSHQIAAEAHRHAIALGAPLAPHVPSVLVPASGAHFGRLLTVHGLHGLVPALASSLQACSPISLVTGPPLPPEHAASMTSSPGLIAVVVRGGCTFATKARHAQAAGAVAVLVLDLGIVDKEFVPEPTGSEADSDGAACAAEDGAAPSESAPASASPTAPPLAPQADEANAQASPPAFVMADDGTGGDIDIPAVFIGVAEMDRVLEAFGLVGQRCGGGGGSGGDVADASTDAPSSTGALHPCTLADMQKLDLSGQLDVALSRPTSLCAFLAPDREEGALPAGAFLHRGSAVSATTFAPTHLASRMFHYLLTNGQVMDAESSGSGMSPMWAARFWADVRDPFAE
jgi:mannosidase alpha-like ER degradation enhancer 2